MSLIVVVAQNAIVPPRTNSAWGFGNIALRVFTCVDLKNPTWGFQKPHVGFLKSHVGFLKSHVGFLKLQVGFPAQTWGSRQLHREFPVAPYGLPGSVTLNTPGSAIHPIEILKTPRGVFENPTWGSPRRRGVPGSSRSLHTGFPAASHTILPVQPLKFTTGPYPRAWTSRSKHYNKPKHNGSQIKYL